VTVTISAALVQDLSPLFFPLFWKATFFAAFPYNWPSHFSCLPEPNSVTMNREAALPLKCLYLHSFTTQMTIICVKCATKASKLMWNNVANKCCRSLQNQLESLSVKLTESFFSFLYSKNYARLKRSKTKCTC
jgi:hypothetical protein